MSTRYHLYVGPFVQISHKDASRFDFYGAFADKGLDEEALSTVQNAEIPPDETWLVTNNYERYIYTFDSDDTGWLVGDAISFRDAKREFSSDYQAYITILKDVFGHENVKVEWGVLAYYS